MKIVIACDSFKGSASSSLAASCIAEGVKSVVPSASLVTVPVADGGEGTTESLIDAFKGNWKQAIVSDPIGRTITTKYGLFDPDSAVMEMASSSGIILLSEHERNPFITSSRGTGEMILDALDQGVKTIFIGIGGSATNDGGLGMAQALGVKALNSSGEEVGSGINGLQELATLHVNDLDPRIQDVDIYVFSDVKNPLTGENGATCVFGPQKGLKESDLNTVDALMANYGRMLNSLTGRHVDEIPGAGAAGGLGAALMAFTDAKISSGAESILNLLSFESILKDADLVITGEGYLDATSLSGKTPIGVANYAKKYGIPVIAIVGGRSTDIDAIFDAGIDLVIPIIIHAMSLEQAMNGVCMLLREAGKTAIRAFLL